MVQGLRKFAKYILSEGKYEQRQRSVLSNSEHCVAQRNVTGSHEGRGMVHEAMLHWPLAFLNPPEPCVEVTWLRVKGLCFGNCVFLGSVKSTSKVRRRPGGLLLRFTRFSVPETLSYGDWEMAMLVKCLSIKNGLRLPSTHISVREVEVPFCSPSTWGAGISGVTDYTALTKSLNFISSL